MKHFDPDKFYIGAYILQPYARTEKHIRDIKNAHIDFMVSLNSDKQCLDLFEKYGIGAIVNDVMPRWWGGHGENSGKMRESNPLKNYADALQKFSDHNAIWGIDVGDEISSSDFDHLKDICTLCKENLGHKLIYTNLYPNYGSVSHNSLEERKKQWGCDSYSGYVENYCQKLPLDYICFDYYLYSSKNFAEFTDNLKTVSEMMHKYQKNMWFIGQISSSEQSEFIDETMLKIQAYCAMAFGAQVIMWACYTVGWWYNHALNHEGEKTPQYESLKNANAEIAALGKEYIKYKHVKTHQLYDSGKSFSSAKFKNVRINSGDGLIVAEMTSKNGEEAEAIFAVAVGDYMQNNPCDVSLHFECTSENLNVYCNGKKITPICYDTKKHYTIKIKYGNAVFITA